MRSLNEITKDSESENPQEHAVHHHRHKLPVIFHLKKLRLTAKNNLMSKKINFWPQKSTLCQKINLWLQKSTLCKKKSISGRNNQPHVQEKSISGRTKMSKKINLRLRKNQPSPRPRPPWCTPPCKEPTRLLEEALDNFQESPDLMTCVLFQLTMQLPYWVTIFN